MPAPHVLIVEDDEPIRTWLEFELSQEGYVIRTAQTGAEGMQMLDQGTRPDIVLLDVNLPGVNGFDMCRRMKANPATAAVPVLFVTARAATDDLLTGLEVGGVEYITKPFKMTELKARVTALLNQAERERTHHRQEWATEIDQAAHVQNSLMMPADARVPGLDTFVELQAARQLGGDFVHFCRRADGGYSLAEGDVSGKGLAAALMATALRTELRITARAAATPSAALAAINEHLYDDLTEIGRFVTAFLAFYDPARATLEYSNAGHSLVVYKPAGGAVQILEADSPPLGILPEFDGADATLTIGPDDLVLIVTDGVYEAMNADGICYGIERLLQMTARWSGQTAAAIGHALLADVDRFCGSIAPSDDRALMILKGKEAA